MDYKKRIREICRDAKFREEIEKLLYEMVEADTSPTEDIPAIRANEEKCFGLIRDYIGASALQNAEIREEPVSPRIKEHRAYTRPYYTVTEEAPEGLPLEKVYEGRHNLLCILDGGHSPSGRNTALNAHIDVVSPFFPPRAEGEYLYGRGSCDDKANAAVMLGALRILGMLSSEKAVELKNKITAMFVIEEETGGNGSLSLVISRELRKRYDSILVLEACDNNIHPANRGAVWFKCDLKKGGNASPGISPLESMCFAVLSMQEEGAKIKAESDHPLFPHRPVQTCNGILGPFGEHPSRICGKVSFTVRAKDGELPPGIKTAAGEGVRKYTEKYGDKTLITDSDTGKPKVAAHYDIAEKGPEAVINVYGSTGHMGSILENDDAIVKWAYIARELIELKKIYPLDLRLAGWDSSSELTLEGGQGFIPTHNIEDVQARMRAAAERGVKEYLRLRKEDEKSVSILVSYDKLHNNAFDGNPDSPSVKNAVKAGIEAGIIKESDPIKGWDVSCDARLFAELGIPVITSGVGSLKSAHSNDEYVRLPEIFPMIIFTALFLLRETGSVKA